MLGPHAISSAVQAVRYRYRGSHLEHEAAQNALDYLSLEIAKHLPTSDREAFFKACERKFNEGEVHDRDAQQVCDREHKQ